MGGGFFRKRHWVILLVVAAITLLPVSEGFGQSSTPILIELFTSEGCSSCPPADEYLRELDHAQPVPGARLIVLEEHVDYWDDQGWKDPFSSHASTLRQSAYEARLDRAGPYTPQLVVDGTDELGGNNGGRADQVFRNARARSKVTVEISSFEINQGKLRAHVTVAPVPSNADVLAAIALDHAQSQVLRGENHDRHLEHVAVLVELSKIGKVGKGQPFSRDVILDVGSSGQPYRLITWVQERNQGKVIGAALARQPQ